MNMGLSGPQFRRGCFQLFTEQGLLGLENGEEETVFNFVTDSLLSWCSLLPCMPPFSSDLSLGRAWGSITLGNNIERSVFHFAQQLGWY